MELPSMVVVEVDAEVVAVVEAVEVVVVIELEDLTNCAISVMFPYIMMGLNELLPE